jgi:hypothetical protein
MADKPSESNVSKDDIRRETAQLIAAQNTTIAQMQDQIDALSNTVDASASGLNFAGISNILDNSAPEWSKAAYLATGVNPSDAGDTNLECYGFFRQLTSDVALSAVAANALKAAKTSEPADHSLWAANEAVNLDIPRWNKPSGWMEIGGVTNKYDLFYQVPNDIIFPGQPFIFQFEAQLRTIDALPAGMQFYAEFYDNTGGQQKVIEGGSFTITDDNGNNPGVTVGVPGSTSVNYQILARTDSGEEALSNVLNFPNAPAVFDSHNFPRVKFSGVAGFIEFEIYRQIGTTFVLQFTVRNSIDSTYSDIGNPPEAFVASFPTVTTTKPRAFALTTNLVVGTLSSGFIRNALNIFVPTTYDRSVTGSGMQYLRIGLTLNTAVARQVLIRKLGLSMGDGSWARSPHDVATGIHSSPSNSTATGSPGGGGIGIDPPPPSGGGHCILIDQPIRIHDSEEVPLKRLVKGMPTENGGPVCGRVKGIKLFHASHIYIVEAANGCRLPCTPAEPFITSKLDYKGTPASVLKARLDRGEKVTTQTMPGDSVESSEIVSITEEFGDFTVGDPSLLGPKIFIAGGFLLHNKPILEEFGT